MWALLFIVAAPSDYTVHSVYEEKEGCIEARQRYVQIFEQSKSKLKTACVLRSRVPQGKRSTLVVLNEVVR